MQRRNTIQRQLVLSAVRRLACHASAEQIYEEVLKEHPNISKTTVYMNLELLAEMGEINRVETATGPALFDHITKKHYHIRCKVCSRYFDMDMDVIEGLEKKINDRQGFDIEGYDIIVSGISPACKAAMNKKSPKPHKP